MAKQQSRSKKKKQGGAKEFGQRPPLKSQDELTCKICELDDQYINPATERCGICDIHIFARLTPEEAKKATRKQRGID